MRQDSERYLKASNLPPHIKQQLWQGIKRAEPETAHLLKHDQIIQALQSDFDASIVFTESDIKRFISASITE